MAAMPPQWLAAHMWHTMLWSQHAAMHIRQQVHARLPAHTLGVQLMGIRQLTRERTPYTIDDILHGPPPPPANAHTSAAAQAAMQDVQDLRIKHHSSTDDDFNDGLCTFCHPATKMIMGKCNFCADSGGIGDGYALLHGQSLTYHESNVSVIYVYDHKCVSYSQHLHQICLAQVWAV
jgi:hypothetical protein